jgi:[ribosomal protein S5]-alanine N-acetyltransferase
MRERRLRAERPWREHAPLYRHLFADRAVAAVLWPRESPARVQERAEELLAADIAHWQERSFGPWVFFEAANGMFVGRGGLHCATLARRECVEVLYALLSEAWGRGYATEMAALAVAHARRLGLGELVGVTATGNPASRRVLEKVGIRFDEVFERGGLPHLLGRTHPIV